MTHAKVLAKYFLAEGVLSKQEIFVGSLDDLPAEMLRRLPKPLTDEEVELEQQQDRQQANEQPDKNGLRIAFRYNDLPLVNSEQATAKIGHHFNLMQHMDSMMLYYAQTTVWDDSYKEFEVFKQDDNISNSSNSLEQQPPSTGAGAGTGTGIGGMGDVSNAATEPETDSTASSDDSSSTNANANANADNNINNNINNNNTNNNNATESTANNTLSQSTTSSSTTPTSTTTATGTATAATTSATSPATQPSSSQEQASFFHNPRYDCLLNCLQKLLRDECFELDTKKKKNLCRVCLTSLGSPLWYDDNFATDLLKFLTVLRASVRSCTAVCFITMPMHLIAKYVSRKQRKFHFIIIYSIYLLLQDTSLVPKIRQLVDYSIELESFAGSERETHPAFKEYSGLLHLHKMTALNTLAVHMPETTDLAFKLRRKKFVIEKMHLPPGKR